ncbi:MAG: hypothetical protein LBS01_06005 [Prevotellaceae bacterium]|nr:hypothetical protein [Prevotellaceae bacterium]
MLNYLDYQGALRFSNVGVCHTPLRSSSFVRRSQFSILNSPFSILNSIPN